MLLKISLCFSFLILSTSFAGPVEEDVSPVVAAAGLPTVVGSKVILQPSDIDKLALVHVRAFPFVGKEIIPGNSNPHYKGSIGNLEFLTPQCRSTVHFSVNSMVPDTPATEEPQWSDFARFAVITPLTKNLLRRAISFDMFDLSIMGVVELDDASIFIAPEGSALPFRGAFVRFYPPSIKLRDMVHQVLKENELFCFSTNGAIEEETLSYEGCLDGKPIDPTSLFNIYNLPPMKPTAHSHSYVAWLEQVYFSSPFFLFLCTSEEAHKEEYEFYFITSCLWEEMFNVAHLLEVSQKIYRAYKPTEKTNELLARRLEKNDEFYRLWLYEKEMVLKERKSFLITSQWPTIFLQALSVEERKTKLREVAEEVSINFERVEVREIRIEEFGKSFVLEDPTVEAFSYLCPLGGAMIDLSRLRELNPVAQAAAEQFIRSARDRTLKSAYDSLLRITSSRK